MAPRAFGQFVFKTLSDIPLLGLPFPRRREGTPIGLGLGIAVVHAGIHGGSRRRGLPASPGRDFHLSPLLKPPYLLPHFKLPLKGHGAVSGVQAH